MKKVHFEAETDGFYGAYWKNKNKSDAAIILMLGDDPEDHMAKSGVKWLHRLGVNVISMSPGKKDYGHHNYPLERIENAIMWLKKNGIKKIGIVGASDDCLCDTVKYINRMEERLKKYPHDCKVEIATYEHGTHFVFPEGMLKTILSVFSGMFVRMAFKAAREYPKECKETRLDIDRRVIKAIKEWM